MKTVLLALWQFLWPFIAAWLVIEWNRRRPWGEIVKVDRSTELNDRRSEGER